MMHMDETEDLGDEPRPEEKPRVFVCDRCGFEMIEIHCKVICLNCGSRWDCSDLNLYMD